jgi:hypothetical protein
VIPFKEPLIHLTFSINKEECPIFLSMIYPFLVLFSGILVTHPTAMAVPRQNNRGGGSGSKRNNISSGKSTKIGSVNQI